MEFGLAISLLFVAMLGGFFLLHRSASKKFSGALLLLGMVAASGIFILAATRLHRPPIPESDVLHRPIEVLPAGYASSDSCQACHPGQYATWDASYHSSMTQVASLETVLGDFDDRLLRLGTFTFQLSRKGNEFWVDMPHIDADADGGKALRVKRRILLTTGSHHMQTYWYGTDNTRVLGLLPFVYNVELSDWLPRGASFIIPPHDRPVSELGRWNKTCLECHVTQGRLRPIETAELQGHDTHVAEFGISCESCHGPGQVHVEANSNAIARYAARFSTDPRDDIVQPEHLDHERSAEVCGQCHSTSVWTSQQAIDRFMQEGFKYRPGDVLADSKAVVRGKTEWNTKEVQDVLAFQPDLIPNTFWADGMNRVAGREYNGLIETACFLRGEMSCLSCHQMHKTRDDPRPTDEWANDQLKPGMRGNLACTQCHVEYEDQARVESHTNHSVDSTGSVCYNCHMPHTTYGLLGAIRSHQIDIPSVQAGIETGRPIACSQCHLDRTMAWTAEWLETWYGIRQPPIPSSQRQVAGIPLMALQGDAGQRALAAWSMSWPPALAVSGNDWEGLYLGMLLGDPYPAVRHIAYRSLLQLPGFDTFEYDAMAPTRQRQEKGNAALQTWAREHSRLRPEIREQLLIDYNGPQMQFLLQLLQDRDDRPLALAE